jgi:oxygen-independent coproporphyrinogen-3 oxidase
LFHPAPEITLELNPDDVTGEYLNGLFETGVNRLSIGIQSFFNEDLEYLGRSHDVRQAEKLFHGSWLMAHGSSSRNVSVDFIYGIPTLTDNRWRTNLQRAIDAGVPHISAYALTVEPKTPLDWMIRRYPTPSPSPEGERSIQLSSHPVIQSSRLRYPVSDDQSARQFEILMDTMEDHGYIQYEISNFCLPGFESIHNSNYWKGIPYLGLGPSAHSFNGSSRRWNVPNLTSYIRHLSSGTLPCEGEEHLTITRHYNEYVMTSLRTVRGCNLSVIAEQFGDAYADHFRSLAQRYINSGHLTGNQGVYTLSRNGKFLADGISAELFMEES